MRWKAATLPTSGDTCPLSLRVTLTRTSKIQGFSHQLHKSEASNMRLIRKKTPARGPVQRKRHVGLLLMSLAVLPVSFLRPPAVARSDRGTPSGLPSVNGGTAVVTNVLWRVRLGAKPDLMSTASACERDAFLSTARSSTSPIAA